MTVGDAADRPSARRRRALSALAAFALGVAPAFAQTPPVPTDPPAKWGPFIDFEGKVGTRRNLGEGDLFVPLHQNRHTLIFGDIRTRFDDGNNREGNFGLGIRHMLEAGWNLGAYGYFDRRRTRLGDQFSQATFGAEALSLDWDARINGCQPVGSRLKNLDGTSSSSAALAGTAVEITTTGIQRQEIALGGVDAEIGWRTPLFDAADTTQLRLYGGAYRFAADGVHAVQGPRARIDLTIDAVPHLWEGARLELGLEGQHDGPRGSQGFALLRLRIPLQVFSGESPQPLTAMERRMTDRVVRDVDIVSQTRSTATTPLVERAVLANGQALSSVTTIDSATTTGAQLPGAIAAAGANSTVILTGQFITTAATTLNSGQTLVGGAGALAVHGASGHAATFIAPGGPGTIDGKVAIGLASTLEMGNNSTVSGLFIKNTHIGAGFAVFSDFVDGVIITGNTLYTVKTIGGAATALGLNGGSGIIVRGNTLFVGTAGVLLSNAIGISTGQAATNVTVAGNTFQATGGAINSTIDAQGRATSFVSGASTGNIIVSGTCTNTGAVTGFVSFTNGSTCP